ncbi:large subunit DNA-packing terminase [Ostreid herpesvirus 1]|uniref:Uncharacterized protein ORF109 n=1 Tax=Ostreid herpesvirus 1 (isolate France) TaxID=654903 RepID=Y109_OSHVF|nr:ORF109 [Ostreid herpesvirus 1]Q6R7C1.1 RecName: Full=Uncharacterized protein ORF109 [Ostreid herpesvirus 1 (isolate France)]ADD24834.1 ORF108 [Chlamys acute necrobiotic virus]AAS00994.1 ORF109 [Ostreid herpesvirus 1]AKM21041.1 ORF109 [Ostreid herpesvirus 1]ASK05631.1 ORF109 [Ostreid herpesvirus 1]ASK05762.1 ORF109 [Ostreid herpesvirus 1]
MSLVEEIERVGNIGLAESFIIDNKIVYGEIGDDIRSATFSPVIGYHTPSEMLDLVESRMYVGYHNPKHMKGIIARGPENLIEEERVKSAIKYAAETFDNKVYKVKHRTFDVMESKREKLDEFLNFIDMAMSGNWFKKLTMTVKSSGSPLKMSEKFYRLPFQQMLMLDVIVAMSARCDLGEYIGLILNYSKTILGLDNMSAEKINEIGERLKKNISGYIIPRRCGKSSFSGCMIALVMAMCPSAGIKCLYTAHKKNQCTDMYSSVEKHVVALIKEFNRINEAKFLELVNKYKARKKLYKGFYYKAAHTPGKKDGALVVSFYKFTEAGRNIKTTDIPMAVNEFRSIVYKQKDTHRGATYNLMFVDETNFLQPAIFNELFPMLNTDKAKMICTSSQKNGQDAKPFVDIRNTRQDGTTTCVVEYVCPNHCMSLIRQTNVAFTVCNCNIFSQPLHINAGAGVRKIMAAFSVKTNKNMEVDDDDDSKSTMLSEIGIMPPGLTKNDILGMNNLQNMRLTSELGRYHFLSKKSNVLKELLVEPDAYSKTVLLYLDPTPTSYRSVDSVTYDRSLHAISAIAQKKTGEYVVLGIEEFTTQKYEKESHDASKAMASIIMAQVTVIHKIYEHFNEFILIPEVNSFDLDNVWYNCGLLLREAVETTDMDDVSILAPCMITESENGTNGKAMFGKKRKIVSELEGKKVIEDPKTKKLRLEFDADGETNILDDYSDGMAKTLTELSTTFKELEHELKHSGKKYKIGYRMNGDKVGRFIDFFSNIFNRKKFTVAENLFSASLGATMEIELAEYLLEKLDNVVIRTDVNKRGKKSYSVSGKSSNKNQHCADDLAVSAVMATSLYNYYRDFKITPEEALIKLQPIYEQGSRL